MTDDAVTIIDNMRATVQRLMAADADVTVEKMPVNRAEAEYLRDQAGDEWFDDHCVEYGPLPTHGADTFRMFADECLPTGAKPGPGAKWGERRAFLEGKKR